MNLGFLRVHIVGAGGAGMSAIAKILASSGHVVSGSDLRGGAALESLADLGLETATGHDPGLALQADLVLASSAVPDFDEELTAARAAGIEIWRRPQVLDAITRQLPTIGATGTHGKTTTTALLVTMLRGMGQDPSFIVGGDLVEAGTNGHLGADELLVIEADEAFRTFESLHLRGLIVTNVEIEHLDHFGDEASLLDSFTQVAEGVQGPVVVCADDAGADEIGSRTDAVRYGTTAGSDWLMTDLRVGPSGSEFNLVHGIDELTVSVPRPGAHVARNAAGALALLGELGEDVRLAATGLRSFRGVSRRWEHRGTVRGVTLYDDYAHHPTEVKATIEASRQAAEGRLWAVFQPHLYSRTERFSEEFGRALAGADIAVVTDVYGAREEPVPGVTGEMVAEAARRAGVETRYVSHRADLASYLAPRVEPGDFVLSMGAGDITLLHAELAALLATD